MALGSIRISKEYKDHPSGIYRYKRVCRGRSFYGEIREYKTKVNGRQLRIYWAAKLRGEYVKLHLAWAYDKAMISKFEAEGHGITHIGVMVTLDSSRRISNKGLIEEYWLTTIENFRKHRIAEWNYEGMTGKAPGSKGKTGSDQWLLPLTRYVSQIIPVSHSVMIKSLMI